MRTFAKANIKASIKAIIAGTAILMAAGAAQAQSNYPDKIIKFVVGYPGGGITDIAARLIAAELEPVLGQKIVVDNRPGGSGAIGANLVAKAPADGYTIYYAIASHTILPALNKELPYDTAKDLIAITQISSTPNMLAISVDSPIKTLADLVKAAKEKPGALSYSTPGYGTTTHLSAVLLEDEAGIKLIHSPYKSSAASVEAAIGKEVTFVSTSVFTGGAAVKDGKLQPLAVADDKRFPTFPNVPTFKELGYKNMIGDTWMGLLAPRGTPPDVVQKLYAAVQKILANPTFRDKMMEFGAVAVGSSPADFQKKIDAEVVSFKTLGEKVNLKVE